MTAQKVEQIIVFVERNRLQFWGKTYPQVLTLDLPPTTISDLEVRKFEDLSLAVKAFVQQQKISAATVFLIFSEKVCFSKGFVFTKDGVSDVEVEEYLKTIPFDYLLFKTYKVGKTIFVVAINREFYDGIRSALENLGFSVLGAIPAAVTKLDFTSGLSVAGARELLKRFVQLRTDALVLEEEGKKMEEEETSSDPRKNRKLLTLLAIFLALLVVLGLVAVKTYWDRQQEKAKAAQTAVSAAPPILPSPTVAKTEEVASAPGKIATDVVRVQVLNGSGVTGQAESVKKQLIDLGFKNVEIGNSSVINSAKIQMVFSASASSQLQQEVLTKLTPLFPLPETREGNLTNFDLVITLTKIVNASSSGVKATP